MKVPAAVDSYTNIPYGDEGFGAAIDVAMAVTAGFDG